MHEFIVCIAKASQDTLNNVRGVEYYRRKDNIVKVGLKIRLQDMGHVNVA